MTKYFQVAYLAQTMNQQTTNIRVNCKSVGLRSACLQSVAEDPPGQRGHLLGCSQVVQKDHWIDWFQVVQKHCLIDYCLVVQKDHLTGCCQIVQKDQLV